MNNITLEAPAKINLYLDVLGKRPDGYHEIESIMQSVSLCDIVDVTLQNEGITLSASEDTVPLDEKNLAHKAARLFYDHTGIKGGAKIHIEKRIPVSSGLAGGSTDAGATLKALNQLYDKPLTKKELLMLGAKLGADVPFCMEGGCALCRGVGEIMTKIEPMTPFTVVIARGGEGVSTPAAYRKLDENFGEMLARPFSDIQRVISAIEMDDLSALSLSVFNTFESVILGEHKEASLYRGKLLDYGALTSLMSGSGPAVFGIFDDTEKADYAHHYLYDMGAKSFVCTAR